MKVESGKEDEVFSKVIEHEKIKRVLEVLGPYDMVVEAEIASEKELEEVVITFLRGLEGVKDTITLVVMKEQSK